jgi:hypothetical protein
VIAAIVAAAMLCIDAEPCIATEGSQARVTPAAETRRFVWIAADRSAVAIGSIEAGATDVAFDSGASRMLHMNVPADVTFDVDGRWRWTIAKPPVSFRLIHPPCPDCILRAEAEGFRPFEKRLSEVRDVVLHAWPHVRGRVIDHATNATLPGATITASDILVAKTDADGAFDARIEGTWPRSIKVEYPGRAARLIALPVSVKDTELPPITLSSGGALRATIETPMPQKLTWELRDPKSSDLLRTGTVEPSATFVAIDRIGEGKQTFILRGSRPLQQFGTIVDIEATRVTEVSVAIVPGKLDLEVTQGSAPFADAKTTIGLAKAGWKGELRLDEHGRATEEIWQRGLMDAGLYKSTRAVYVDFREVQSEQTSWQIAVPNRRITGRIIDATTGDPVREARLTLTLQDGIRSEHTDDDGRFTFEAIDEGTHTIDVIHEGARRAEGIPIVVGKADGAYTRDIRLGSRDAGRPLTVTDHRGLPVAEALVLLASVDGVREVGWTDVDGTANIPLGIAGRGIVFVVPRSGSFAFTRVMPRDDGDLTISIRVPAPSAAIEVQAHADGAPLKDVLLVPRVDGMMLPGQIMDALNRVQGVSFFTDANGRAQLNGLPRGVYELWAVTGRDAMRAVRSAMPPPPSASLDIVSGRYDVRIGFSAPPATP